MSRDRDLDILKGVGMLLVIIGHTGCIWPIYFAINAFHMPLFFIVSGYFFSTQKHFWGGVKVDFKRLIVSYLLVSLITCVLLYLIGGHYETFAKMAICGTTISNAFDVKLGPVWFLLALFWCRIIYRFLAEIFNIWTRTIVIVILAFFLLLLRQWFYLDLYKSPFQLSQGIVCMFYYHAGVLIRQNNYLERLKNSLWTKSMVLVIVSSIVLIFSVVFYRKNGFNMNLSMLSTPLLPIDTINAIALTLSLYLIINYVGKIKYFRHIQNGLKWIGENSMAVFMVHCVEYQTLIPVMLKNTKSLIEMASMPIIKGMILLINPIVNITVCIFLVMLWQQVKIIMRRYVV